MNSLNFLVFPRGAEICLYVRDALLSGLTKKYEELEAPIHLSSCCQCEKPALSKNQD